MGYLGYGMMGGFGGLGMLLFWALVIGLAVWGAGALVGRQPAGDSRAEALEIVKRRFAAGEITEAELEIAKRALA